MRALGAEPVVLDALDALAVGETVAHAQPDAIVYEATALADLRFGRTFDRTFAQTNWCRVKPAFVWPTCFAPRAQRQE